MTAPDLPPAPLALRLFGPFEVTVNGAPLPRLRSHKVGWLLALLALRSGREVDRAWLVATFWPASTEKAAYANLRSSLKDLRQALGPEAHRLCSPAARSLCLDLTGAVVDALAFDQAITRGDVAGLETAAALYRGPLLEECAEEWLMPERRAREEAYLHALETLAEQALAHGNPQGAERWLRRAAEMDPLRESVQRGLMAALAAGGSYGAALLVYRELRQRLHREIHAAPDPETEALFQQLRSEARAQSWRRRTGPLVGAGSGATQAETRGPHAAGPASELSARSHNLPAQTTPLLGRGNEVAAVRDLLRREAVRLVTLTGPGGTGKTRLGLQVAAELIEEFPAGAFFVALAPISDPCLVLSATAQTLGVRETSGMPLVDGLKAYLAEKQLLLLLDNFEQVVDAAPLIAELLAAAPRLKVLVTSRAVLHLRGEREFAVPPLDLPDLKRLPSQEALTQYAAVELFIQRALDFKPDFAVTNENAPAVAAICHRLDGLPLAIELAAARIKLFAPQALLARLDRRLSLLTGGARDLPARQQTLRATIDWSYDLLDENEKTLFRRLSVFMGGCTLEAAEAVCDPERALTLGVLDGIASLIDKSLLQVEEQEDGGSRFGMLETIREYARERLEENGEAAATRGRHLEFFLGFAEEAAPKLFGPEAAALLERLETEIENLRAALTWSAESDAAEPGLRLAAALTRFWDIRGYWAEGRRWLEEALAHPAAQARTLIRGKALSQAAHLAAWAFAEFEAARLLWEESLAIAEETGGLYLVSYSVGELGQMARERGDRETARALLDRSLAVAREAGDTGRIAAALSLLADLAHRQGDLQTARILYDESLTMLREPGLSKTYLWVFGGRIGVALDEGDYLTARALAAEALANARELGYKAGVELMTRALGTVALNQRDYRSAREFWRECLELALDLGRKQDIQALLERLAGLAAAEGRPAPAVRLWGAATALGAPDRTSPPDACEPPMAAARAALGEGAFAAAWAEGQAMSLDQACACALQEPANG